MKKTICMLLTAAILIASFSVIAFAVLSSNKNIDIAKKAVKEASKTNYSQNDMSMEEYLEFVKSFIPKELEVEIDYSPYGNFFRCINATEESEGKVSARFIFYHQDVSSNESDEQVTFKIKKLATAQQ